MQPHGSLITCKWPEDTRDRKTGPQNKDRICCLREAQFKVIEWCGGQTSMLARVFPTLPLYQPSVIPRTENETSFTPMIRWCYYGTVGRRTGKLPKWWWPHHMSSVKAECSPAGGRQGNQTDVRRERDTTWGRISSAEAEGPWGKDLRVASRSWRRSNS